METISKMVISFGYDACTHLIKIKHIGRVIHSSLDLCLYQFVSLFSLFYVFLSFPSKVSSNFEKKKGINVSKVVSFPASNFIDFSSFLFVKDIQSPSSSVVSSVCEVENSQLLSPFPPLQAPSPLIIFSPAGLSIQYFHLCKL